MTLVFCQCKRKTRGTKKSTILEKERNQFHLGWIYFGHVLTISCLCMGTETVFVPTDGCKNHQRGGLMDKTLGLSAGKSGVQTPGPGKYSLIKNHGKMG